MRTAVLEGAAAPINSSIVGLENGGAGGFRRAANYAGQMPHVANARSCCGGQPVAALVAPRRCDEAAAGGWVPRAFCSLLLAWALLMIQQPPNRKSRGPHLLSPARVVASICLEWWVCVERREGGVEVAVCGTYDKKKTRDGCCDGVCVGVFGRKMRESRRSSRDEQTNTPHVCTYSHDGYQRRRGRFYFDRCVNQSTLIV